MERYALTPNEIFVISLINMATDKEMTIYLSRFLSSSDENRQVFKDCLHSLQDKNVILKEYHIPGNGETFIPGEVLFGKNFTKNLWKASNKYGEELFENYPMFGDINGVYVPIKTVSKHFGCVEDAFRFYGKTIKFNIDTHNHILELLNWAKENTKMINCSFSSFIINRLWEAIEAMKNGDQGNVNFDTVRML